MVERMGPECVVPVVAHPRRVLFAQSRPTAPDAGHELSRIASPAGDEEGREHLLLELESVCVPMYSRPCPTPSAEERVVECGQVLVCSPTPSQREGRKREEETEIVERESVLLGE